MKRYSRKKNSTKIFIAATIVTALLCVTSYFFSYKENKGIVVAKINDEKIFKSEIEQKLSNIFNAQNQEIKIPKIENMPKEVIEILAKEIYFDKTLTKEAKKSKIAKDPSIKAKIKAAENKILRQSYIDSLIKSEVTDQKINNKYIELTNELAGKKEFLLSHIVVRSEKKARRILRKIKYRKIRFSDAAKKYSLDQDSAAKNGNLGYITEDNIIKEISDAISKLEKNKVSNPIHTKFGWHLIKFSDIRNAKPPAFKEIKDNIRAQLTQEKINEINYKITKNAKIEILIKSQDIKQKLEKETAEKNKAESKISNEESKETKIKN